jgi:integrase
MKVTLDEAVREFHHWRDATGIASTTRRQEAYVMRWFLTHVGNIYVQNVTPRHVDDYLAARRRELKESTLNLHLAILRAFFRFAEHRRMLGRNGNPVAMHKGRKVPDRPRLRVPVTDFPRLLDAAQHPRDRVIVAIGLYTLIRQSAMRGLRVADVDLVDGYLEVFEPKTGKRDAKPIGSELDAELRRWLTWYGQELGRALRPDDHLVPAKTRPGFAQGRVLVPGRLDPTRAVTRPHLPVQNALIRCGYATRDELGRATGEGVHTLRRSAARAMFDRLVEDGHDGAIRIVQSMLGHSTLATTEHYIGVEPDRRRRDEIIRGKQMFPTNRDNVVALRRVVADGGRA